MKTIRFLRDRFFPASKYLPSGFYPFQSPPNVEPPYRLHLRLENDGSGVLVINARTVLHLNPTAAELAYHIVQNDSLDATARKMAKRYNVSIQTIYDDARDFQDRIQTAIDTPALDPVTFLDFERVDPYSRELSAPYRLDCALTYKTEDDSPAATPAERVKRELLTDEWKSILQKSWQVGIPQVVFTGGEPTLRPDLNELISFTQNQGQVTGLLTNGKRLAEHEYLEKLLQSGLDHVMISLDPESSQAWEAIRDVSNESLFLTTHLTLTAHLIPEIDPILARLQNYMGKNQSLSLSANNRELSQDLVKVRDNAIHMGFEIVWDLPVPYSGLNPVALEKDNGKDMPDGAGTAWLYVEPDGDVLKMQGIPTVLGNILSDPWEKIWNNPQRHE